MWMMSSFHGQEHVDRHNERHASLARLGRWVACLDALAYQLVRAGRDLATSQWLEPPARQAFAMCMDWVELQTGDRRVPNSVPNVVVEEPAADSVSGRALVGRITQNIGLLASYDLALGASSGELPGDFDGLWRWQLEPWSAAEPLTITADQG